MPNIFRRVPHPPFYPDCTTFDGRYELFRRRARWFTLRAFDYELAWQQGELVQPVTFDMFRPERGYIPPGETLDGWISPAPRDPFEPIRPVAVHETYGTDWRRTLQWFSPLNPAGLGILHSESLETVGVQ